VGIDGVFWPGTQRLIVGGLGESPELPRFEARVGAGLALGRAR